jgi:anthranilate phosphoribosyltransferase
MGGDAARNASIVQEILNGEQGAKRDIVIMNSAAGLVACRLAEDLRKGVKLAEKAIDSGAAGRKLEELRKKFPVS